MFSNTAILGSDPLHVIQDLVQDLDSQLGPLFFPASEHDRDFHFVPFFQEPDDMAHLEIIIVPADLGPEFDLLDLDLLLVLSGFVLLLVELV